MCLKIIKNRSFKMNRDHRAIFISFALFSVNVLPVNNSTTLQTHSVGALIESIFDDRLRWELLAHLAKLACKQDPFRHACTFDYDEDMCECLLPSFSICKQNMMEYQWHDEGQ